MIAQHRSAGAVAIVMVATMAAYVAGYFLWFLVWLPGTAPCPAFSLFCFPLPSALNTTMFWVLLLGLPATVFAVGAAFVLRTPAGGRSREIGGTHRRRGAV